MVLNVQHTISQPLYDAIPPYWEVCQCEETHHIISLNSLPYFTLALALIVLIAALLIGNSAVTLSVIACMVVTLKVF